jgi:hypothetical protein
MGLGLPLLQENDIKTNRSNKVLLRNKMVQALQEPIRINDRAITLSGLRLRQ